MINSRYNFLSHSEWQKILKSFSSVQQLSHVRLFVSSWSTTCQASLSFTNSRNLLKLMPIESVMPSNHLIFCHPLLLLPSIFPSIRVFSSETVLRIRWPKYWSFSFSVSSSNEYSGLIYFRNDLLDLLEVQGTLKSLLHHHSSKASILRCSAFFLSPIHTSIHDYWKNHSFDQRDLCWQSNVSVQVGHNFSSKEQVSFTFMAAVTICSDFGAPQNSLSLFPSFPHLFT